MPTLNTTVSESHNDASKRAVFARAQLQWQTLGAERERWLDPEKQRELAAAFLRYHAAKLALETPLSVPD
jgi:hypothetical protein